MSRPRDEVDAWLDRDVEPLVPPPGTFERVSKRARQRKRSQAILSAAAAVVVIAAVAIVPQAAATLLQHGSGPPRPAAAAGSPPAISLSPAAGSHAPSAAPSVTPAPAVTSTVPWTTPSGEPAASRFRPTSITLIGPDVGAVIGQASCAADAERLCTSLAATVSDGSGWYAAGAPPAGPPSGSRGVSQLRFLNVQYGWAFGPALYATADGAASWVPEAIPAGLRVIDLETAGDHAFALFASCSGAGSSYGTGCTSVSLYSSAAGSMSWQQVRVPPGYRVMTASTAGQSASARLVLASGTAANPDSGAGYVLAPSGELLTGPLTGGPWKPVGQLPAGCHAAATLSAGQGASVQLASGALASGSHLLLSCDGPVTAGGSTQAKVIYTSPDGSAWRQAGIAPGTGTATSLAAFGVGGVVLATSTGIDYSTDGGASWAAAGITSLPTGGFSYVGMTTATSGVAVPADPALGEVFITADGGQAWSPRRISGG